MYGLCPLFDTLYVCVYICIYDTLYTYVYMYWIYVYKSYKYIYDTLCIYICMWIWVYEYIYGLCICIYGYMSIYMDYVHVWVYAYGYRELICMYPCNLFDIYIFARSSYIVLCITYIYSRLNYISYFTCAFSAGIWVIPKIPG